MVVHRQVFLLFTTSAKLERFINFNFSLVMMIGSLSITVLDIEIGSKHP